MIEHVVFDFGAVLIDWRPAHVVRRHWPHWQLNDEQANALARAIFASAEWQEFDAGRADGLASCAAIHAKLQGMDWPHARPSLGELCDMVLTQIPQLLQPIASSIDALRQLKAQPPHTGLHLHYLSNMPAPYADALDARFDFIRWFDSGIFSCRERVAKPEAAVYELAHKRFGITHPQAVLFIDDHPANIAAAHAVGWQTIHLTQPGDLADQLLRHKGLV
jgi:putative hydrolase of the HAD superfamily